jgi:hypothetical protein
MFTLFQTKEPLMPVFNSTVPQGQYMDIRDNISLGTTKSLQLTSSAATQYIMTATAFGVVKGSVTYDAVTGAFVFNESGYYSLQAMLNCQTSGNVTLLYRAATLDASGNPVAFATAGRSFSLTSTTDSLVTILTKNYWTAGTRLILYFTTSNVTNLVLSRAASTPIGVQAVSLEAFRVQIQGFLGP